MHKCMVRVELYSRTLPGLLWMQLGDFCLPCGHLLPRLPLQQQQQQPHACASSYSSSLSGVSCVVVAVGTHEP